MQPVQFSNNSQDTDGANNNDGLLIHIDNGNIVAESVGIPDIPTEGRRVVVPAPGHQGEIHEGSPPSSDKPKGKANGSSPLARTASQQATGGGEEDIQEETEAEEGESEETDRLIK
jgi:hypothetical protein